MPWLRMKLVEGLILRATLPRAFLSHRVFLKMRSLFLAGLAATAAAHSGHKNQKSMSGPHQSLWYNRLPGDGGTQVCCSTSPALRHLSQWPTGHLHVDPGRLRLLGHHHLRPSSLPELP